MCLYPEGRQNRGKLVQARTGVVHLTLSAWADIPPVAVIGVAVNNKRFKSRRQLIRIGKVLSMDDIQTQEDKIQDITDYVMYSIAGFLPEELRGFYV